MAYTEAYTINFKNEQSQEVVATIYKKDGPVVTVENYMATDMELNDRSDGQTKYDSTIIARELTLTLWSEDSDSITWETFIADEHDTWKIIITVDGQYYFHGFITPDEGNSPFQDKPYEVTFRATNGLALLKDTALVKIDGSSFTGSSKLIDYIAAALWQTGVDLPIRIYCNYFNKEETRDRTAGLQYDMFGLFYLEYRTFLKDATNYVSCYDALMIILDKFCRLEYWNGMWLIKSIAELQYMPGNNYYTDYNSDGSVIGGTQDLTNHYQIGKAVDIYPINEDQQIYSRFALKTTKTTYNYTPWPEIPRNSKFERGDAIPGATGVVYQTDENGDDTTTAIGTYQDYTIPDWDFGTFNNPPLLPGIDSAWRRSSSNQYGVELNREIIIAKSTTNTQVLQSEGLPVYVGDRLNITFDFKLSFNFGAQLTIAVATVYIVPNTGGNYYFWRDGAGITNQWRRNGSAVESINLDYIDGTDHTKIYKSVSLESQPIPVDGTLYIQLINVMDNNTPNQAFFRNFEFEYKPFVAGGYIQVKGDKWTRSQNKNYPDVADDTVKISDAPKKMLQGALLLETGELTPPTWYRYGTTNPFESWHFKYLLNLARYNHSYRRMYALDGSFNGLNCAAENDQLNKFPIRFDKRYRVVDMADPREFVLVPPLKMDLIKGWINASLVEVRLVSSGADGTQLADNTSFNYIFE